MTTYSPTIQRFVLAAELKRLREAAGMDSTKVAKQQGWDPSKVSRLENAKSKRPALRDVSDLLTMYGVTDDREREAILALARASRERGWWTAYADVFKGLLPDLEAGATQIQGIETVLVPGLLQTPAYAEAVFRAGRVLDDEGVRRHVEGRMARQKILWRDSPPVLWAVIDEAALRKLVGGPEVMREQLRHLVEVARRPAVNIQVFPDKAGAHAAMVAPFTIFNFATEQYPSLVYMETPTNPVYQDDREEVEHYDVIYRQVVAEALPVEESVRYMAELADQLK
ncbi:helix-turn-helix domain-containing protein [Streptosporangium amethystogenes subsp. fukuiense]|uniref:Helix-turn-helix domain-containing protein n=1 Tax=Streptosporangium amethystogenes subsp. fukuiense TaxID=698418 RepID=A0ABW2T5G8_9ACTN